MYIPPCYSPYVSSYIPSCVSPSVSPLVSHFMSLQIYPSVLLFIYSSKSFLLRMSLDIPLCVTLGAFRRVNFRVFFYVSLRRVYLNASLHICVPPYVVDVSVGMFSMCPSECSSAYPSLCLRPEMSFQSAGTS